MKLVLTLAAVLSLAIPAPGTAQNPAPPSARDLAYYRYFQALSKMQGGSIEATWMADGKSFWYPTGGVENTIIRRVDPATNRDTTMFDVARLRKALAGPLGHEPAFQGLPFRTFSFTTPDERAVRFTVENRPFEMDLASYTVRPLPPALPAEAARRSPQVVRKAVLALVPDVMEVPSPDGLTFAGIKDNNLQLRSAVDGRAEVLTNDGIDQYAWDVLGAQWSPDGKLLALTKSDTRATPATPIVHWLRTVEEVEWVRLGRSGGPMPQTELYLFDVTSRARTRIDTGKEPDQLIALVGWRKDGSEILFTREDRRYKKLELLAADAATGASRVLITETAETFVRPAASPLGAAAFKALGDGQRFLWLSERTGWNNLYLYDFSGKLIRALTPVAFPITEILAVDDANGWVYFTAHGDQRRPYDTFLYRVGLNGQPPVRLTDAPGMHNSAVYLRILGLRGEGIRFSPDMQYFLDTHSSLTRPMQVDLRKADGTLIRTVAKADTTGLGLTGWRPPEEFTVKAADGVTDLYGVIYRPASFDSTKKYPVVDYIYNGPQTTWVARSFNDGRGVAAGALAQVGFCVVVVDGRGTTDRSKQFQDVVYRNFGRNEIPDHVATLRQLFARHPELDSTRVGVIGGSFGGYMTLRAMLLAPEVYEVGVANAPVADLYGVNVDMYMDLPRYNAAGYEYASNLTIARNLEGKLLLTHGTSDVNAPFGETVRMIDALTRAGKTYELMILPEETHALTSGNGAYRSSAERHFLERYLMP